MRVIQSRNHLAFYSLTPSRFKPKNLRHQEFSTPMSRAVSIQRFQGRERKKIIEAVQHQMQEAALQATKRILKEMGQESKDVTRIGMAALMHDIGKMAIPDMLLQKTVHLSTHERALLEEHAELGAQILETSPFLHDLNPAVHHHHEHWDGSGYPNQLSGYDIPLASRIIGAAEAYDSMLRDHPYQVRLSQEDAMAELRRCAGTQFDPKVIQALLTVLERTYEQQNLQKFALRA
jgi:HD-GYP domain-containing protein (c-di-GMP phosphodiesterase class II)